MCTQAERGASWVRRVRRVQQVRRACPPWWTAKVARGWSRRGLSAVALCAEVEAVCEGGAEVEGCCGAGSFCASAVCGEDSCDECDSYRPFHAADYNVLLDEVRQLDFEDDRSIGWDIPASRRTVREAWRDIHATPAAYLHPSHPLIETRNQSPCSDNECYWPDRCSRDLRIWIRGALYSGALACRAGRVVEPQFEVQGSGIARRRDCASTGDEIGRAEFDGHLRRIRRAASAAIFAAACCEKSHCQTHY